MKNATLLFLFLLTNLSFHPTPPKTAEYKTKLSRQLSKILGIPVKAADVYPMESWQIQQWDRVPERLYKKLDTEFTRFAYIKIRHSSKKLNHLVVMTPKALREKLGIDFFIADNQNSDEEDWIRCKKKMCTNICH